MILYHIHEKQSNIPFFSFFNCWLERKNTILLQKEQEEKATGLSEKGSPVVVFMIQ